MIYALITAAAALGAWLPGRTRNSFSPGQGSVVWGVQYQVQPSVTAVANSSGNVAAATATATLPAAAGKTTWIEGFDVTAAGATAASIVQMTITGLPSAVG